MAIDGPFRYPFVPKPDREFAIDLLRALAIAEVVLAHTDAPPVVFELRNFGVPLLVMLSGMSFGASAAGRFVPFRRHMLRRARRLLVPVWIFLTFYFIASWIIQSAGLRSYDFTLRDIGETYALGSGIGYVWVIRVNLFLSLFSVLFLRLHRDAGPNGHVVILSMALLVLNEALLVLFEGSSLDRGFVGGLVRSTLFYLPSFGAVFLIGLRASGMSRRELLWLSALFLAVFAACALSAYVREGRFVSTQELKYPPHIHYLSYALGVSFVLVAFRRSLAGLVRGRAVRAVVSFVGSNSLWIYLWHIFALDLAGMLADAGLPIGHDLAQWAVVLALSIAATALQTMLVGRIRSPRFARAALRG